LGIKTSILFFLSVCVANIAQAQFLKNLNCAPDSMCVMDLSRDLLIRLYGSQKFTGYQLGQYGNRKRVVYSPNDNYNIGIGFNYRFLGINIGFRAPFVNNDAPKYGKTKFLDLQSYIYMRKVTLDLYGQFYNGYYLSNRSILDNYKVIDTFLKRPDLHTKNFGFTLQYIFNHKKFSYRAAYLQNEYQRKSAGSLITGGGMHYINVKADSAIIPPNIIYDDFFSENKGFNRSDILCISANAGYAHTFVYKQHFFVTAALLGGVGVNYTNINDTKLGIKEGDVSTQLNGTVRFAVGYNSEQYFAGIHYVNFITRNNSVMAGTWQQFEAGNLRISVAKRFKIKKPLPKPLEKIFGEPVDKLEEKLEPLNE